MFFCYSGGAYLSLVLGEAIDCYGAFLSKCSEVLFTVMRLRNDWDWLQR